MTIRKRFSGRLNSAVDARRSKKESMVSIADRVGISRVYLYKLLSGSGMPSLDTADRIAKKLGFQLTIGSKSGKSEESQSEG